MTTPRDLDWIDHARQRAAMAGLPLKDRWGYPASDEDVLYVLQMIRSTPDDAVAANAIGIGNALGDCQLCSDYDRLLNEDEELALVKALRSLANR